MSARNFALAAMLGLAAGPLVAGRERIKRPRAEGHKADPDKKARRKGAREARRRNRK